MDPPLYDYTFNDSDYNYTEYNFTYLDDPITDPPMTPITPVEWVSLIIYFGVLILGVPGNAVVVWMTAYEMKRTVNTVWFLNLAIADLLCCLVVPFSIMGILLHGHWPLGLFSCKLIPSIFLVNMYVSVLTLTIISMDLCALVIKPVWCQKNRSVKTALLACLVVWIFAIMLTSPSFIFRRTYAPYHGDNNTEFCSMDYSLVGANRETLEVSIAIFRFLLSFLIPFALICVCYGVVVSRVNSQSTQSRRTMKVVVVVIVAFFICWFPYHVAGLLLALHPTHSNLYRSTLKVDSVLISIAFINSCINPIIYVLMGRDFKTKFKRSLKMVIQEVQELSHSIDSKKSKSTSSTKNVDTQV
ncbi:C5a anaphylatoxin chemotactic receptor 1-like [Discoglossus pictus]